MSDVDNIFDGSKTKEERADLIKGLVKAHIDESISIRVEEKYKKNEETGDPDEEDEDQKVKEEEEKEGDEEETERKDESDEEEDKEEGEEEGKDEEKVEESFEVSASPTGRPNSRPEVIKVNKLRDLKRIAKTRKYDYFTAVNTRTRKEFEFSVDPNGNLVEM